MKGKTNQEYRHWLYDAGWRVEVNDDRGVLLKHPRVPGTLTRGAAAMVQRGWDRKRKAEVA